MSPSPSKKPSWHPCIFSFMSFSHPKTPSDLTRDTIQPMHHQPTRWPKRWKPPTSTATRKQDLMIRRKALRGLGGAGLQIFALCWPGFEPALGQKSLRWWNFRSTSHALFKSICEVVTTTSQTLCRLVGIMCILMHTCISFPDAIENRSWLYQW